MTQATVNPTVTIAPPVVERTITNAQLIGLLCDTDNKGQIATFEADYDMLQKDKKGYFKKLKKSNPFGDSGLRKLTKTKVRLNFNYAKSMENRGDKASGKGNWQQRIVAANGETTSLTTHKADVISMVEGQPMELKADARAYLACEFIDCLDSRYIYSNGNEVDRETVKPYLKATNKDRTVAWHTVSLCNVRRMTMGGATYRIIG